ncbi:TPA: hypothetical protein ACWP07_000124 [Escherichia coli]
MTSLKTSIKTITYLSDIGCLEIQGASLPRKRKEYIVDSSDLRKYQILGFEDYNHYVGYLATNGLNNLVPEFQILDNADYGDF